MSTFIFIKLETDCKCPQFLLSQVNSILYQPATLLSALFATKTLNPLFFYLILMVYHYFFMETPDRIPPRWNSKRFPQDSSLKKLDRLSGFFYWVTFKQVIIPINPQQCYPVIQSYIYLVTGVELGQHKAFLNFTLNVLA